MHHILFIELLGGIGDLLIALAAIQALARSHPQAKLTVLTFSPGGELLLADPHVDQVVFAEKGMARTAVENLLSNCRFDCVISDTTYDGINEVIRASPVPRSVTNLWQSPPPDEWVSDRFLKILDLEKLITPQAIAPPRLYLTATERQQAREPLGPVVRPLVVLFTDAGMAIKRWSEQNWIEVGQWVRQRQGGTVVLPVGTDPAVPGRIETAIGDGAQLWQRGTLRQLAALFAEADLVIAPDTGAARMAVALGVPTITLFGPSWHGRYGQPLPHANLQGYPECPERNIQNFTEQACWYGGNCPIAPWQTCLEAISPEEVVAAAAVMMGKGQGIGASLKNKSHESGGTQHPNS